MTAWPSRARLLLALAVLAAWWAICWFAAGMYVDYEAQHTYRNEIARADRFTANQAKGYLRIIAVRTGMPRLLARDPAIRRALIRFDATPGAQSTDPEERRRQWTADPQLAKVNRLLSAAATDLGLDAFWLLDASGTCIAASNADSDRSLVGTHYGDREYFKAARVGRNGHQISIGRRLQGAGLSFYTPVVDAGRFVGVVVGGAALAPFGNWFDQTDAFLSDRNGVIVLARDPALVGQALPGALAARLTPDTRQHLYKNRDIATLDLAPWGDPRFPELLRMAGRDVPVVLRSLSVADGEPTLNVPWPLPQLAELAHRQLLYTFSLGAIGSLLMLVAAAIAIHLLEQRAAREREFHTLVDQSPDIIVRYDRDLRRVYVNPAFERLHGIAATDAIGRRPGESPPYPPAMAGAYETALKKVLADGREACSQFEWQAPDGEEFCFDLRIVPEVDREGRVVGLLTIGRDILPLRQAQRQLEASRSELQELSAHREEMREEERRHVAHELHEELGQILSALRLNISTLRSRLGSDETPARQQTTTMLDLADNAIHGLRTTVSALRPTALDAGIAAGIAWQAREFNRLTRISCVAELADDASIDLPDTKATAVFRIVEEALSNVARHAQANHVVIRLDRSGDRCWLKIADDGSGFAPEAVPDKAFGLLGMRERATALGGHLDLASTPGQGTTITVLFPAAPPAPAA